MIGMNGTYGGSPGCDRKVAWFYYTLEDSEWPLKKGQCRETCNIGYTRRRQTKQKHNTICIGHDYKQKSTNNVNKTWTYAFSAYHH